MIQVKPANPKVPKRSGFETSATLDVRENVSWVDFCRTAVPLLLLISGSVARGQVADNWWTVDSGGGSSTGGALVVSGTAGQPDAGLMSGGGYALRGGFWSFLSTLPPRLVITTAADAVNVCWPYPSSGFVLVESDNLINPVWTVVPGQPTQVDPLTWCMSFPASTVSKYYRLRRTI